MPKPTYPDRIEFAAPAGTKDRLLRVLGITKVENGSSGAGPKLRMWLLDWLDKAERGGAVDPVAVCENVEMLNLAAMLLSDPDEEVRKRVICSLENCQDFQDRRRRKAAGETVARLDDLRVRPEDLRALVKKPDAGRHVRAA